jgi:hypothetical protein
MLSLLIWLLILCLVIGVACWAVSLVPLPPPFGAAAQVVLALIFVIVIVSLLLGFLGHAPAIAQ